MASSRYLTATAEGQSIGGKKGVLLEGEGQKEPKFLSSTQLHTESRGFLAANVLLTIA